MVHPFLLVVALSLSLRPDMVVEVEGAGGGQMWVSKCPLEMESGWFCEPVKISAYFTLGLTMEASLSFSGVLVLVPSSTISAGYKLTL